MNKAKIIIVDDHRMFRDGLKSILSDKEDFEIIKELASGKELIDFLKEESCDLVITDISMPDMSGIDAAEWISQSKPEIKVIILSMHINEIYILNSVKAGVKGYLPKDAGKEELLHAIKTVIEGEEYYSKEISEILLKSYVNKTKLKARGELQKVELTERELEVVKLVAEGFMNKEISDQLNISIRTVETHKTNIIQKLKLKSSIDIVKYAIKNGIIEV